jgi:hypothetical protein
MKIMTAGLGNNWQSLDPPTDKDEKVMQDYQMRLDVLKRQMTEVLLAENLVVLTGLGTSLCLTDSAGKRLAPTMGDLWKAVEAQTGSNLTKVRALVGYVTPASGENIELLLSRCLLAERLRPTKEVTTFVQQAENIIVERCRFPAKGVSLAHHQSFLRRVARRSTRLPRMKLFTTNYDLCFEAAASTTRFVVIDGFAHTQPQEFDGTYYGYDLVRRHPDKDVPDFIANVFHLYKLHGSVDWEIAADQIVRNPNASRPLIVYPRDSKFESSYDQPFLEMMSRFQMALRQPNTGLLIIGFGFNDDHISHPIMAAVRANVGLKAVVVDPALESSKNLHIAVLCDLIKAGDSRLTLVTQKFEELVPILPDLVAATEEEKHVQRLGGIGGRR